MKVVNQLRKNLWLIELNEQEVNEIQNYIDLDEIDVEVLEGENVLHKDTLFHLYAGLNGLKYHNNITYELLNGLKSLFVPTS